ncbi:RNA polymerase sigma-70 factor [Cryptosporangium sp. NPDC048952]|uniref:RNA polymerase sigma-70 factor n=1 Tax=Cryptosporangium sp. NPDC048952 TaxID=3363961 RepID=UPI003718D87C
MTALEDFTALRPRLFGIAYRMLGSVAEAEDIVQDAWLRWQDYDHASVREPRAFLSTTVTRLAITAAQSARRRRETYLGPWLPEPVDTSADPTLGAERAEALEIAVLHLMERLTPTERAAYVLREAFDYSYKEIADVIEVSEVSARQLVSRGRKHLASERRATVDPGQQRRLLEAFLAASRAGDVADLEKLFAEDVVRYSDGGDAVRAARVPVQGRAKVARLQDAFREFFGATDLRWGDVNGQVAAVLSRNGTTVAVGTVTASDEGITEIYWVLNPVKLTGL